MSKVVKTNQNGGSIEFKLEDLLDKNNISINKIMKDTNTDFKVIKRLITGDVIKIDIYVLSRICEYLDCSIEDIIEYKK